MEFTKIEKDGKTHIRGFVCIHSKEGQIEAYSLMEEVMERLSEPSASLIEREVKMDNFLHAVVTSLWWNYMVEIKTIATDMWSGIGAEKVGKYDPEKGEYLPSTFTTWIECDKIEHGIAATWKAVADNLPQEEH